MFEQCIECDKVKGQCECQRPTFWKFAEKKDIKRVEKKLDFEKQKAENARTKKKIKGHMQDRYIESIIVDDKPLFLCNVDNELKLAETIEYGGSIYKPLEENECGYFPYKYTKFMLDLLKTNPTSKETLLEECKQKIDQYIDVCERDKHLILGDLFLSYCQEWIDTIHFPYFVGETESGKSSVLHLFRWLGYRCLYGEDIPNADIYNFLGTEEEATGTICEDEAQDLAKSREKIRTYKNSYSRGALKPRILGVDSQNKKQVFYKTFCLKLFAGEKIPVDRGFQERLAVVHMIEGTPKGNIKRLDAEAKASLLSLRNKLLVWKVLNINKGLEKINSGLEKRDQELWEDFLAVTSGTKYFEQCKEVANYYTTQRHQSIWNSLEARIFKLLIQRIQNDCSIQLEAFWAYVTDEANPQDELAGTKEKESFYLHEYGTKITRNFLSRLFEDKFQGVKRIGYDTIHEKKHKITRYHFDSNVIHKLATKYNVNLKIDWFVTSGVSGRSGELADHVDHIDHPKHI